MIVYSTDAELLFAGARAYYLATGWCFFRTKPGGGYDTSRVVPEVMAAAVPRVVAKIAPDTPVLLDIEAWDLRTQFDDGVKNLRLAANCWRGLDPQREIGFYRMLPWRDYWAPAKIREAIELRRWSVLPAGIPRLREWHRLNDRIAQHLCPVVDYLCPSLYDFYLGQNPRWRYYASANLEEAQRIGGSRPVRPIIQTVLHDRTAFPPSQWDEMIEFLAAYPHQGLHIYHSSVYQPHSGWREKLKEVIS